MASFSNVLLTSQAKPFSFIVDFKNAWDRDNQWLTDIFEEAHKLFQKPTFDEGNADQDDSDVDDDVEEPDETGPILLPQTPRVKSARAARMQRKTR
jgi:hypothetical protein